MALWVCSSSILLSPFLPILINLLSHSSPALLCSTPSSLVPSIPCLSDPPGCSLLSSHGLGLAVRGQKLHEASWGRSVLTCSPLEEGPAKTKDSVRTAALQTSAHTGRQAGPHMISNLTHGHMAGAGLYGCPPFTKLKGGLRCKTSFERFPQRLHFYGRHYFCQSNKVARFWINVEGLVLNTAPTADGSCNLVGWDVFPVPVITVYRLGVRSVINLLTKQTFLTYMFLCEDWTF